MIGKNWPRVVKNIHVFVFVIISMVVLLGTRDVFAISTSTINLQGKIVRNDTGHEGLNVTPGNPACVVAGANNDTCDFRVRYYDASSGGTLLLTETFSDKEIGQYNGAFNLSLGSDLSPTTGKYASLSSLIDGEDEVYIEIGFAPGGNNSYTETFTRMPLQASPYAIRSKYASEASSVSWSGIINPEGNQSLTMGAHDTSWNWGTGLFSSNWGSNAGVNDLFTLSTGNITGTGSLLNVQTGSSATVSPLRVRAGSNEAIFVDNQSRVGIGTTSPAVKLDVAGQGRFESSTFPVVEITRDTGSSGGGIYGGARLQRKTTSPANGGGIGFFFMYPNSAGVSKHAGMFGGALATTTAGSEIGEIVFGASYNGVDPYQQRHLIIRAANGGAGEVRIPYRLKIGADSSPTKPLDVTGDAIISGDVGIGTTSPLYKLDVNGSLRAGSYYSSDGTQGVTSTVSGLVFKDGLYTSGGVSGFDNYGYWTLKVNNELDGSNITSQGVVSFNGAGIVSTSRSNNVITITGTEADTLGTVTGRGATTSTSSSFTGGATIRGLTVDHATATRDKIAISVADTGTSSYTGTITNADLTGARTWTLPDTSGTLALTSSLYGSWTIKSSAIDTGATVSSGEDVQILGGTNVTTSRSGRNITISASDTNTATAADDILKGSNIGTEIKYSPYTTNEAANVKFYNTTYNPTGTGRLNIGAHFHATRFFSGNGTAAAPSISFSSNTNTGLFRVGTSILGFSTNGVERWRIAATGVLQSNGAQTIQTSTGALTLATAAGNGNIILSPNGTGKVGIGVTSPSEKLDVNGAARIRTISNATGNILTVSTTGVVQQRTAAEILSDIGAGTVKGTGIENYVARWTDTADTLGTGVLYDNGANVGIGTTSPGVKLEVAGGFGITTTAQQITNTSGAAVGNIAQIGFALNRTTGGKTEVAQIRGLTTNVGSTTYEGALAFLTSYRNTPTEKMRITANGNVGIGTTTPGAKLDVLGTMMLGTQTNRATITYTTNTARTFTIPNTGANADFVMTQGTQTIAGAKTFSTTPLTLSANSAVLSFSSSTGVKSITTGGTTHLALSPGGNVGIGVTSPSDKLDVNGTTRIRTISNATGNILTVSTTGVVQQRTAAEILSDIGAGTGTVKGTGIENYVARWTDTADTLGTGVLYDNGANVGIGTTNPGAKLDIAGGFGITTTAQQITNTSGAAVGNIAQIGFALNRTTGGKTEVAQIRGLTTNVGNTTYEGALAFLTSYRDVPTEKMRITANGNVGINTTSPGAKLSVNTSSYPTMELRYDNSRVLAIYSNREDNVFIGVGSGSKITTGNSNVASGYYALGNNTEGGNNIAMGRSALGNNTTGNFNTALGTSALHANVSGSGNLSIGFQSMLANTTGGHNIAIGFRVLQDNTTGGDNIIQGQYTARYNTTGSRNIAIGSGAFFENVTKSGNTAVGYYAMRNANSSTTGSYTYNVALGYETLTGSGTPASNTGTQNTALGSRAGTGMTSGSNNVLVGYQAGNNITSGSNNIIIGSGILAPSVTNNYQLNIGNTIYGDMGTTKRIGIGISPTEALDVNGKVKIGTILNAQGNILTVSGTGVIQQRTASEILSDIGAGTVGGSGQQHFVARWTDANTLSTGVLYDNGTNVGIGTTSPGVKLEVAGGFGITTTAQLITNTSGAAVGNIAQIGFALNRTIGGKTEVAQIRGLTTNVGNTTYEGALAFLTSYRNIPTEKMRIDANGNVGIGTDTPESMLHLKKGVYAAPIMRFDLDSPGGSSVGAGQLWGSLDFYRRDVEVGRIIAEAAGNGSDTTRFRFRTSLPGGDYDYLTMHTYTGGNTTRIGIALNAIASHLVSIGPGSGTTVSDGTVSVGAGGINVRSGTYQQYIFGIENTDYSGASSHGLLVKAGGSGNIIFHAVNGSNQSLLYVRGDGKIGMGTTSPSTRLHINGDGGILAQGTYGSGWGGDSLGSGARLMWIPSKAAFRAGYVNDTQWDASNIGTYSAATGYLTKASGGISTAMGYGTTASGYGSTTMGYNTTASNHYTTAMGLHTTASGTYSTAIGGYSTASGSYSVVIGQGATASGNNSIAMGHDIEARAYASAVLGRYNVVSGTTDSWVATDPIFAIGIGTSGSNRANAMTVLKNGKTGIGTTSPGAMLSVNTSSYPTIELKYNDNKVMDIFSNTEQNVFIGKGSGSSITTGLGNVGIGLNTLGSHTTGHSNMAIGTGSLGDNTTGSYNIGVGVSTLLYNETGVGNVANGFLAMFMNTGGSYNVALGYGSLSGNTTGGSNVAIGNGAGNNITTGSNNIMIGAGITAPSAINNYQLNIGNTIRGDLNNNRIGIGTGTSSLTQALEINGQIKITGGSPGANKVLVSDASGVGSWQTFSPGSSSVRWDEITNPLTNQILGMSGYRTEWTWSSSNTSTNNLFTLKTANSTTGTGSLLNLETGSGSAVSPLRARAAGVEALFVSSPQGSGYNSRIGLGTASPLAMLHLQMHTDENSTDYFMMMKKGNTEFFRFEKQGRIYFNEDVTASGYTDKRLYRRGDDLYWDGKLLINSDNISSQSDGYTYVTTLYFNSNSTFKKGDYPWLAGIKVKVQGGGGGGGGVPGTASGYRAEGGGGGGGGYSEKWMEDISSLPSSVSVTVGAGGSAANNANGGTGGTSSFGSMVSATGGTGGAVGVAVTASSTIPGGQGGTGVNGDINLEGGGGTNGRIDGNGGPSLNSSGGDSFLGGKSNGVASTNSDGVNGKKYGGGGGGANNVSSSGINKRGGYGAEGVIIVELYAKPSAMGSGGSSGSGWLLGGNTLSATGVLGTISNHGLQFKTNNTDRMIITNTGNVGIGTTGPAYKLDVSGTGRFTSVLHLSGNGLQIANGQGTNLACNSTNVGRVLYVRHASSYGGIWYCRQGSDGTYAWIVTTGTATGRNPDIAENVRVSDVTIDGGDIVSVSLEDYYEENFYNRFLVEKAENNNMNSVIGVVSTDPGIVLNQVMIAPDETPVQIDHDKLRPVALAGRVPAKIATKKDIQKGDSITVSSIPGHGEVSTTAGKIIGTSLSNFQVNSSCQAVSSLEEIVWTGDSLDLCFSLPDGTIIGKILLFVNVSWYDPAPGELLAKVQQLENQYNSINQEENPLNSVLSITSTNTLAVDSHLLSKTNNTYNLGSSTNRWKNVYTQGVISIGENGNSGSVKYDTETKELKFSNDGTNWIALGSTTNTETLSAQYPGSVVTSKDIETGVGEEETGYMHYYEFNNIEEDTESVEISIRYTLPSNFASWSDNAIQLNYATECIDDEDCSVDMEVFKQETPNKKGKSLTNIGLQPEEWETILLSGNQLKNTCTEPGDTCIIIIRLHSKDNNYVRVGDIKFDYNRKL